MDLLTNKGSHYFGISKNLSWLVKALRSLVLTGTRWLYYLKHDMLNFLGGPVVKNLPANTGYTGSIPSPGKSHLLWGNQAFAPQLLKPVCPEACALQREKPLQWEVCVP